MLPAMAAILITGAARRIGRALARDRAARGEAVAVHYHHSRDAAEALVAEITADGGTAVAVGADLGAEAAMHDLVPAAMAALGRPLTALINNASTFSYDTVTSADRAAWDHHMEANLRAPFVLTQAFARQVPPEAHGAVVNIIDQRVWNLTPHFVTYTVSKAGLWTLTQTLALALAPRIRVNGVGPGPTLPSPRQSEADFARQCAELPLEHGTNPAEITEAVHYLLTAPSVTGQMIAVDGGQHLDWAPAGDRPAPEE